LTLIGLQIFRDKQWPQQLPVPIRRKNARRMVSGLAKPQLEATRCKGLSVSSSRRRADAATPPDRPNELR
jgi:hypothetical protein